MHSRGLVLLVAMLFLAEGISADSLFMKCPTVYNTDASEITVNMYYGSPPTANCGALTADPTQCKSLVGTEYRFSVTINGDQTDLLSCYCNATNPGNWHVIISTQLNQDYNITTYINNTANQVTAASSCTVPRKSFNAPFTIPEFSPLLIPLIIFAAISIIRKRK